MADTDDKDASAKGLHVSDIHRMRSQLLLTVGSDSGTKLSAFWVLIVLSGIIATAGVIADSTATVIGAMIVAPLMTPILGTALSVVLADSKLIVRNLLIVLAGATTVIVIGFLIGLMSQTELTAATNSQIASRVAPRLIDLVAALATGVVGAFANVRADISDTLPGVAIAISLVPPLAVVGLTLESGAPAESLGALLLFGTNVSAIIATGTIIFLLYRVRHVARKAGEFVGKLKSWSLVMVISAVLVLAVPLGIGSTLVVQQELLVSKATPLAKEWAEGHGWHLSSVDYSQGTLKIIVIGPPPSITESGLREKLDAAGLDGVDVRVSLVFGGTQTLEADS